MLGWSLEPVDGLPEGRILRFRWSQWHELARGTIEILLTGEAEIERARLLFLDAVGEPKALAPSGI